MSPTISIPSVETERKAFIIQSYEHLNKIGHAEPIAQPAGIMQGTLSFISNRISRVMDRFDEIWFFFRDLEK